MSLIIPANSAAASGGYAVDDSLRFNVGSSDYLNRTQGTATSAKIFTLSMWVKISTLGEAVFFSSYYNSTNRFQIYFNANGTLTILNKSSGSTNINVQTNRVFRDISAWYNLIVAIDTTQGTDTNRVKLYVNGVQETSFSTATYPSVNNNISISGSNYSLNLGRYGGTGSHFGGYMSEVVFVDGTAQANTDLGEFDEDSGIWKPIDVSGLTFGTNGFYLDFEDSSALGNDAAGSNNFTVNNLTAIDQSTDTCTNNFATGNPLDNGCGKAPTFSEGNLKYVSSSTFNFALPTIGVSSGKWYMEIKYVAVGSGGSIMAGITDQFDNTNRDLTGNAFAGGEPLGIGYYQNGNKYLNNVASSYGSTYTTGDIIGVYLDVDNSKLYFAKNGTLQNSGTGLDLPSSANSTGVFFFMPSVDKATIEVNYGNPTFTGTDKADANGYGSFKYSPSAGTFDGASKDFYALNTKNLSEYG